jgi:small subunit ribosomal protein S5
MTKEKKQDLKDIKRTIDSYETISEEEAIEKAKDSLKVAEEMLEKDNSLKEIASKEELIENGPEETPPKSEESVRMGETWMPKTKLGKDVKEGKIKNLDDVLESKRKILEPEIVDWLISVKSDLISIGQSKGKFGGGKRRAWRQTQRKTAEGNIPTFSTMAVIGDENGHVGIGTGEAKETLPARDKAIRKAKLNAIKVVRACSAFDCACNEKHTIPFKVVGKAGSVRVTLIPAPQGTGLVVANELKKVLKLAGIKDIYSRTSGSRRTTFNMTKACINALKKTHKQLGEKNVSDNQD